MLETQRSQRMAALVGRRPLWVQLGIVAALGAALLLVVALGGLFTRSTVEEKPVASESADSFRPTAEQWTSLTTAPVKEMTFRALRQTDGKIAYDDDTTTPVFSPYTGRVTQLFAKAGDHVEKGAPLMAVAASEFVQGQNDLIAALQGLNAARAQLRLATINEKRQHELYDAKAGALKDWQQAQADLESAKASASTAEIALAAVRGRLRILGASDAEIARIEIASKSATLAARWSIVTAPIGGVVPQHQVGLGQYIGRRRRRRRQPGLLDRQSSPPSGCLANVREEDAPLMQSGRAGRGAGAGAIPARVFKAEASPMSRAVDRPQSATACRCGPRSPIATSS